MFEGRGAGVDTLMATTFFFQFYGFEITENVFASQKDKSKTLKKFYGPFLWMGFNCLKARATSRKQFTFYH